MKIKSAFLIIMSFALLQQSCKTGSRTFANDYTYLYDAETRLIKPNFKVFHHAADSSTLYFEINSKDVLYGKFGQDSTTEARIKVRYFIYPKGSTELLDSNTISLADIGFNNEENLLYSYLKFKVDQGSEFDMEVRFRDEYKDFNVVYHLQVDKRKNYNSQYFLMRDQERLLLTEYSPFKRKISIEKSKLIPENEFLLETANPIFDKAPPPFVLDQNDPKIFESEYSDTLYFVDNHLDLFLNDKVSKLSPLKQLDVASLYIYYYYEGFPEIISFGHVLDPIRYISTTKEYNALMEAEDSQKAFEKFWLKLARDQTAAKKMIAEYFDRVEIANQFFTSYKPGWKTDRGIIYIVYGQPYEVQIQGNTELWLYGEENNILSVKFQFRRVPSDWTESDFKLLRDENYKNNWYRAVDVWRQGRIY